MKFSLVSDWLTDLFHDQFKQFSNRSSYALGMTALGLFFMSLLSWKLLLAIAMGLAVTYSIFELQQPDSIFWRRTVNSIRKLWQQPDGKAIISGSSVSLFILLGFALTQATGRSWIAATLILQSLIGIGIFALWKQGEMSRTRQSAQSEAMNCDRYINDLAHPVLLRRMIAVRRLHHGMLQHSISRQECREIQDYFQILLGQETDSVIRLAIQDALETCQDIHPERRPEPQLEPSIYETFEPQAVQPRSLRNHGSALSTAQL